MKNIYQNYYSENRTAGLEGNPRIKIMLDLANDLKLEGKNILDVGCNDGTLLSQIKNRNNNFLGLEISEWAIAKCKEKNIEVMEYFFDDETKFPCDDNCFDLVIAGEIIEHIYDTDFFLQEVRRVLKPGGKLLISTPNVASLGRRAFLFFGKNPLLEISPNEERSAGHIRYFTRKELENFLKKHNFKIVKRESDVVNFSNDGKVRSALLARIFPTLAASLIVLAKKI